MTGSKHTAVPGAERRYMAGAAQALHELLGERLIGVYAGGSWALGDYRPGRSDLDLAAISGAAIPGELKQRIVGRLRHESLACPARGLELVVYRLETARSAAAKGDFELNLNSGAEMRLRVQLAPTPGDDHWFPIDRSILAQAGVAITGPPSAEVFTPPARAELLPVLIKSVRWHRQAAGPREDAVLNACRGLRFATEGRWSSKLEAGRWAIEAGDLPAEALIAAVAARRGEGRLDRAAADRVLDQVGARLERLDPEPARLRSSLGA